LPELGAGWTALNEGGPTDPPGRPQNTGLPRRVSSARRALGAPLLEALDQELAAVALGAVEHLLEQRLERRAHRRTGRDAEDPHHVVPVHREVLDAERLGALEQLLDAPPHLLQVGREAGPEPVAEV